jgi:L-malate glycosyltransferase
VRVLITPEWYPDEDRPYFGVFCREQARAAGRRHDVIVLAWKYDRALRVPFRIDEQVEDDVRTIRVRFRGSRVPRLPGAFKLAGVAIVLLRLRRERWLPDVIHAHEYVAGSVALLLGRVLRRPVVVSEHYGGFARGVVSEHQRAWARDVFERAAVVCPVSLDLERHLRALAPTARFQTVPNVVDDEVFLPADDIPVTRAGGPLRLVTVGNLVEVKGHRYLLEALSQLRQRRTVTLDVLGDGELRDDLGTLTRTLGLDGDVRFLGQRAKAEVAATLRAADVFVLPSLGENMPCALLEALSCGLPAVASRVGGVPEVLDESSGMTVEPGSAVALSTGLDTVASRLDRYDRRGTAAATRARYGYDAIGRRWSEVYARAVGAA